MARKSRDEFTPGDPFPEGQPQESPDPEIPGAVLLAAPDGITNVAVESVTYPVRDGRVRAIREHAGLLIQMWGFKLVQG